MTIKSNSRYGVRTKSVGSSIKKDVAGKIEKKARPTGGVMIPFKNQQQLRLILHRQMARISQTNIS